MNTQTQHYQNKLDFEIDSSDLFDALQQRASIIVIDARKPEAFEREHIPGAINFPHRTMNEETTLHLNKGVLYVTYCDGIGCNASTKGAFNLVKLGFQVKELMGGLDWWKRDEYSTEGVIGMVRASTVTCAC